MKNIKLVKKFIRAMVCEGVSCTNIGVLEVDRQGYIFSASITKVPEYRKRDDDKH